MKNKILLGISAFALAAILSVNVIISKNASKVDLTLNVLNHVANAQIEIPIDWGDNVCRCNDGICQDGNWISFRPQCAYIAGGASDEACRLAAPSC